MVASDRVSAFDVIMAEPIPDKGRVLTAMTAFWCDEMARRGAGQPDHRRPGGHRATALGGADCRPSGPAGPYWCSGPRCSRSSASCAAIWPDQAYEEYERSGTVHGTAMPAGLQLASRLAEPIFTPSTKATEGHDLNIDFAGGGRTWSVPRRPAPPATSAWSCTGRAAARCADAGFVLADTKFELGYVDGVLCLCDEVCTPDSSRLWPADQVVPGQTPPAFDKQPLRDWLAAQPWDRTPPPPPLPDEVTAAMSARYVAAYERVTGRCTGRLVRCRRMRFRAARRGAAAARHRRSGGCDDRAGAARPRLRQRRPTSGPAAPSASRSTPPTRARPAPRRPSWPSGCWPTPSLSRVGWSSRRSEWRRASASSSSRGATANTTWCRASRPPAGTGVLLWHGDAQLGGVDAVVLPGRLRPRGLPAPRRAGPLLARHGRRCGTSPGPAAPSSGSATASRS